MVDVLFFICAAGIVLGALGVVFLNNVVHAVLSLVFSFLNAAVIYVMVGAEFVALSTIIVYVGAVSVLLLFIVMTLTNTLNGGVLKSFYAYRYWIVGLAVAFAIELLLLNSTTYYPSLQTLNAHTASTNSNVYDLGVLLYTKYMFLFVLLAVLLFVAMVGAVIIVFQNRSEKYVRRQSASTQVNRDPKDVVDMVTVKKRGGI